MRHASGLRMECADSSVWNKRAYESWRFMPRPERLSRSGAGEAVDQFEDQFEGPSQEPLGLPFDEEGGFFHPEEVHDSEEFAAAHPVEESIYTDDPVRVYLRAMGAVPLLTRDGELNLARRMERGKLRMQKAISRSALVQLRAVAIAEQIKRETEDLNAFVDLGDLEEESAAYARYRAQVKDDLGEIITLHKKLTQLSDKMGSNPLSNKKLRRRRWAGKLARCRAVPFLPGSSLAVIYCWHA